MQNLPLLSGMTRPSFEHNLPRSRRTSLSLQAAKELRKTTKERKSLHVSIPTSQVWPQGEFPLIPVGRVVLNRNPKNYFAEVEQLAFSPAHLVPGIEPSPDKMLQVSTRKFPISMSDEQPDGLPRTLHLSMRTRMLISWKFYHHV